MVYLTYENVEELLEDDQKAVDLANIHRESLSTAPSQSEFRVFAILIVETEGKLILIAGANSEQGYIGGAICAERAAICSLRFLPSQWIIRRVIVVTDSEIPISPGALCREYLMSVCQPETIVIMGNRTG